MLPCVSRAERDQLARLVQQWNENRLDLFSLTYPSQELEMHGVMRFYFQESTHKVATKCIRVSSTATTRAVVDALVDKFHPDLKMLSNPQYSLWEVHENGEERSLAAEEKPLLVQLNWHKDDREGRFLLRKHEHKVLLDSEHIKRNHKRFSKREKKELKKKHQRAIAEQSLQPAAQLYQAVPPTTFTRTISNPEIVMKKRRERKLEAKLNEMAHGGSLKVYGYELVPSKPYVTLLVSVHDSASKIVRDALDKYGRDSHSVHDYCLVQVLSRKVSRSLSDLRSLHDDERYVPSEECPLLTVTPDMMFILRKTTPAYSSLLSLQPRLVPFSHGYGSAIMLMEGVTEVGSAPGVDVELHGDWIKSRHAAITVCRGVVTMTRSVPNALLQVNGQLMSETVQLRDGDVLVIGQSHTLRFLDKVQSLQPSTGSNRNELCAELSSHGTPTIQEIPALLSVSEQAEDTLLTHVLGEHGDTLQFKLGPALILYMVLRHRLAMHKQHSIRSLLLNTAHRLRTLVLERGMRFPLLAFWIANCSELLHFVQYDVQLHPLTQGATQQTMLDCLQTLFNTAAHVCREQLQGSLLTLMDCSLNDASSCRDTIDVLTHTVQVLRQHRVNAAFTIQMFSQLFHFISAHLFNWLLSPAAAPYCTCAYGMRLAARIDAVHGWAKQQGMELPAVCHLDKIQQAVNILITPKTLDHLSALGATCYSLNSVQVCCLLQQVQTEQVSEEVVDSLVRLAETQADRMAAEDGVKVQLHEPTLLSLPFLLPDDGYCVDSLCSLPPSISSYADSLEQQGLCCVLPQSNSTGSWAVHLKAQQSTTSVNTPLPLSNTPAAAHISFFRGTAGIGLSIVAAQGIGEHSVGIYVKKVVEGSAAHRDGRLECGDQLLSVNGQSLVGISQGEAAALMSRSGAVVSLQVKKHAARYNGLQDWLINPPQCDYANADHCLSLPLQATRSASTSELYRGQMSLRQPQQRQHVLPAHYRTAPRPLVLQPGRTPLKSSLVMQSASNPCLAPKQVLPVPSKPSMVLASPVPSKQPVPSKPHIAPPSKPSMLPASKPAQRDELNERLDQLEVKGSAMNDTERRAYRSLVDELARKPVPCVFSEQRDDDENVVDSQQNTKLLYTDEQSEPRAQVLGAQEVYRDPRQRRLNEIQARHNASREVDGTHLGFKDKMRLFAEQLGESCPNNKFTSSSAQRDIEHS